MRHTIRYLAVALTCSILAGCDKREQVGGGYVLVTPATMGPDHHPGTSLQRNGTVVWGNVYVGHFSRFRSSQFYHDGMFVFVGPVPNEGDWWSYPQLFALRGSGLPVVLSERLVGEPLIVSSESRPDGEHYAVKNIVPTDEGVSVLFTHSLGTVDSDPNFIPLSWGLIRQLLDEAASSSRLVRDPLGDYRVLPMKKAGEPLAPGTPKRSDQPSEPASGRGAS